MPLRLRRRYNVQVIQNWKHALDFTLQGPLEVSEFKELWAAYPIFEGTRGLIEYCRSAHTCSRIGLRNSRRALL